MTGGSATVENVIANNSAAEKSLASASASLPAARPEGGVYRGRALKPVSPVRTRFDDAELHAFANALRGYHRSAHASATPGRKPARLDFVA